MMDMMASMMSAPGVLDSIVASNPMLQQMMDSNPMLRPMLSNPDFVRSMLNPQMMSAAMRMQQARARAGSRCLGRGCARAGLRALPPSPPLLLLLLL
jgi:hypothetical protein